MAEKDFAWAECELDGVTYGVSAERCEDGTTRIRFTSSNPPRGLHEVMYEFIGKLPERSRG